MEKLIATELVRLRKENKQELLAQEKEKLRKDFKPQLIKKYKDQYKKEYRERAVKAAREQALAAFKEEIRRQALEEIEQEAQEEGNSSAQEDIEKEYGFPVEKLATIRSAPARAPTVKHGAGRKQTDGKPAATSKQNASKKRRGRPRKYQFATEVSTDDTDYEQVEEDPIEQNYADEYYTPEEYQAILEDEPKYKEQGTETQDIAGPLETELQEEWDSINQEVSKAKKSPKFEKDKVTNVFISAV